MNILKRSEVNIDETWDLSHLFLNDEEYFSELTKIGNDVDSFQSTYDGKINSAQVAVDALNSYADISGALNRAAAYSSLSIATDQSNAQAMERSGKFGIFYNQVAPKLNFLFQQLRLLDENVLQEIITIDSTLKVTVDNIIRELPHTLSPELEDALSELNPTLDSAYATYNMHKLVDMKFDDIVVDGKSIPMTFGYFEDELAFADDIKVRHAAFDNFHKRLSESQNTVASIYNSHIQKEKAMAKLKGFDNTIDYLLFNQEVSRDMYDRQIDLIMEHLAPAMRKFAKLLGKIHNLDKVTYSDLHLVVDPNFEPDFSIEQSREQLLEGLSVLGDDYLEMINKSFDERWIDFPQNIGKSTGAFCSSPYGANPYVLISWTHKMREVFVLAHELGHAGHFYLSQQHQSILNARPSLYFIEAPSTMNELLMANHLKKSADDLRLKRWILSTLVSRTYYHNFVTHLIEAAYQREVYLTIDRDEPINASVLNKIYRDILEQFWGDAVEINIGAELTWMRQPHYYMGLYPYTYSAGLTIATQASEKLLNDEISIEDWKNVLKAGGTKTPLDLAKMVDVDLSTEKPLMDTINYISNMIDEIIEITEQLD